MTNKIVSLASDHRGFYIKSMLIHPIQKLGFEVQDLGPSQDSPCDASDFAVLLAKDLKDNPQHRGVLICGSGQAMAMTVNRYQHIRAALCINSTMARLAREHNDANVLVLGAHIMGQEVALDCLKTFLETGFLGGRYLDRREKLTSLGGL